MTLVAVKFDFGRFVALSDSRISSGSKISDHFVKLHVLPFRFTSGGSTADMDTREYIGELGFGFEGSALFSMQFLSVSENVLSSMHCPATKYEPPAFDVILETLRRVFYSVAGEVNQESKLFSSIVFGFCPKDGHPFILKFSFRLKDDVISPVCERIEVESSEHISLGSGAKDFEKIVQKSSSGRPFELLFDEAVRNGGDSGTGGHIQVLEVSKSGAVRRGVQQFGHADQKGASFWGLNSKYFDRIEGYALGRGYPYKLEVRNLMLHAAAARRGQGIGDPKSTGALNNLRAFSEALAYCSKVKQPLMLDGAYTLDAPVLIPGEFYFSKICTWCNSLSHLIHDPSAGSHIPACDGSGVVKVPCPKCGLLNSLCASEFISIKFEV